MTKEQLQAAVNKRKAELIDQSNKLADIKAVVSQLIKKVEKSSVAKKLLKDFTEKLKELLGLEDT